MLLLQHIWARFPGLFGFILVAAGAFFPAWYAHTAIDSGLAPRWIYIAIAGLIFVGCVVTFTFLRKARDGVSPCCERRRR